MGCGGEGGREGGKVGGDNHRDCRESEGGRGMKRVWGVGRRW